MAEVDPGRVDAGVADRDATVEASAGGGGLLVSERRRRCRQGGDERGEHQCGSAGHTTSIEMVDRPKVLRQVARRRVQSTARLAERQSNAGQPAAFSITNVAMLATSFNGKRGSEVETLSRMSVAMP